MPSEACGAFAAFKAAFIGATQTERPSRYGVISGAVGSSRYRAGSVSPTRAFVPRFTTLEAVVLDTRRGATLQGR